MGRESELQPDEIDKKINSSHRLRRILAGAVGMVSGGVGYLAGLSYPHPELRPFIVIPLLPLILAGAGVTAITKSNEERLQSSIKKTFGEPVK